MPHLGPWICMRISTAPKSEWQQELSLLQQYQIRRSTSKTLGGLIVFALSVLSHNDYCCSFNEILLNPFSTDQFTSFVLTIKQSSKSDIGADHRGNQRESLYETDQEQEGHASSRKTQSQPRAALSDSRPLAQLYKNLRGKTYCSRCLSHNHYCILGNYYNQRIPIVACFLGDLSKSIKLY